MEVKEGGRPVGNVECDLRLLAIRQETGREVSSREMEEQMERYHQQLIWRSNELAQNTA
jgi:hypothetical protein